MLKKRTIISTESSIYLSLNVYKCVCISNININRKSIYQIDCMIGFTKCPNLNVIIYLSHIFAFKNLKIKINIIFTMKEF